MHRWVVAVWVDSKVELLVPKVVVVVEEDQDEDAVETKGMHRYRR